MDKRVMGVVFAGVLMLGGCSKSVDPATAQTATVHLKDGTTYSGTVVKSDTSAITVQAANGESRTYPMSQVDNVKYDEPAPAASTMATETKPSPTSESNKMASSTSNAPKAPVAAAVPLVTIPAGTTVRVRNSDTIRAGVAEAGQKFPGVVTADVIGEDGAVAIPKGSNAMLIVRSSQDQGKMQGQSELAIDLASVEVGGRSYNLETRDIVEKGKQGVGENKRSAKFVGGGAVLGTIIGAVAGGGKGAAIGAAAGAGAGVATQAATRGKAISIPSETILSFKLEAPVAVRPVQ